MLEHLMEYENEIKNKYRLINILKNIIDTISAIEDIEIMTELTAEEEDSLNDTNHSPETTWFFRENENQKYIYIPPEAFSIPELEAKAKAAHESGHAAITRYYSFKNDDNELFKLLLACTEERVVDTYISNFGSTKLWIKKVRIFDFVNTVTTSDAYKKDNLLGKLLTLIIYSYYIDDIAYLLEDDVLKEFNVIKAKVDFIEKFIPDKNETEENILKIARKRFNYVKNVLYPMFSKTLTDAFNYLVEKKAVNSFSKEMLETIENSKNKDLEDNIDKKINELYPEVPTFFKNEFDKLFPKKLKVFNIKISKKKKKKIFKKEILPEIKKLIRELYKNNNSRKILKIKNHLKENLANDFRERREKLEVIFYDEKESFFGNSESKEIENLNDIFNPNGDFNKKLKLFSDNIHINALGMEEANSKVKGDIDNYWDVVSSLSELIRELKRYLKKDIENKNKKSDIYTSYGNKVSLKKLYERESSKHSNSGFNNKFFVTKGFKIEKPKKDFDWSVIISVDISGSMYGKIDVALHGVILLAEVLSIKNIEFKIVAFNSVYFNIKEFNEELNTDSRVKIAGVKLLANRYSSNLDYQTLSRHFEGIKDRTAQKKIVITISDGIIREDIDDFFQEIKDYDDIKFIGIGIGGNTQDIEKHYPLGVHIKKINDLPLTVYRLLYGIIKESD